MADSVQTDHLLDLFEIMVRIRAFEEVVGEAHRENRLPGLLHLSIGGEAVAAGVISHLRDDDRIYSSHRAHGHFLASGSNLDALMGELAGRETGLCRGRGGSMHLMDTRAVLATGVVGGTLPIAVGHALALSNDAIAVVFFGDGAVQSGVFHESLNLAALFKARVLFVCENNGMAEFTSREEHTRVENVVSYAELHDINHLLIDGSDIDAVERAANDLILHVRQGEPAVLECAVTRIRPHYEGDMRVIDNTEGKDPVEIAAAMLSKLGVDAKLIETLRQKVQSETEQALERALEAPMPQPHDDINLVFAKTLQ